MSGPVISFVGTRNRHLRPAIASVTAVRANAEADTMSFVLPDNEGARIKADLDDNGHVALTIVEPVSHETYQYKGKYLSRRPGDDHDQALVDIQLAKIVARLIEGHYPGERYRHFVFWPGTLVTFRVEDIFIQTPGPAAGRRIEFAPEPR